METMEKWVWVFIMVNRLAPLVRLGVCEIPNLGLGSQWGLLITQFIVFPFSPIHSIVKVSSRLTEVIFCLVFAALFDGL